MKKPSTKSTENTKEKKELRPLPEEWVWTTLGETGELLRGVSYRKEDASEQAKNDFVPVLRATNIQDEKLVIASDLVYVPSRYIKTTQYLKPGDIVVCMSSGSKHLVGKTAQLYQEWKGSFGTFCAAVRPQSTVDPKFLGYFFSSPEYRQFIRDKSVGININNLKPSDFESLEIPLPPLAEQNRIVTRLEELLSDLDAGKVALERARAGVKRYKASVLNMACEGRIFRDKGITNGELPKLWRWVTVKEIGKRDEQSVLTGPFGTTLGREDFTETGIPVLTIGCLTESGLNLAKAKYISLEKAKELHKYQVRGGDLLFSRMATVGRAGLVTKQFDGIIFNYHIMRLRLDNELIDPNYFLLYVRGSRIVTNYVKEVNHGATRDGINTEQLLELPVALPPFKEQRHIVSEVDRRLDGVREVEAAVELGLKHADRLRQSILRIAFEGRM